MESSELLEETGETKAIEATPEIQEEPERTNIPEEAENSQIPAKEKTYKADIILAKKTPFETKLFQKVLDSLGYSYDIAHTPAELENMIADNTYKIILLDKELQNLHLEKFSQLVKTINKENNLRSYLVLMTNSDTQAEDLAYVHETIRNIVNKDLLRLVIEKFI